MARLAATGLIWLGCLLAWLVLGSSLLIRTRQFSSDLENEVHLLWGPPQQQEPPRAFYTELRRVTELADANTPNNLGVTVEPSQPTAGRPGAPRRLVERTVESQIDVPLESSAVDVRLGLEHRRKGLLWFATYDVGFRAEYEFTNPTAKPQVVTLRFPLGKENAVFDDFRVTGPGDSAAAVAFTDGNADWHDPFAPGETRRYRVQYRSRGTSTWHYRLTSSTGQVRNFRLGLETNFHAVDFPPGSLSPSHHARTPGGWRGDWTFASLVANAPIGVALPERLNPGPLAARITFFAPIGLLFFFFVVSVFASAQGRGLHPMHFLMIGCAFFAFHLLFSYLVDHLAIGPSFAISAVVSILLVVTYARLFTGWPFALREMGISQLIYLVLFSFTFFWQGFTGLAITVGAIITLFVMMQYTGRIDWAERMKR